MHYETVDTNQLSFEMPYGKWLYESHVPFASELHWLPLPDTKTVNFMPTWIRIRVVAHDGNGNTSSLDAADTRYVVLFSNSSWFPADRLSEIPVNPFAP